MDLIDRLETLSRQIPNQLEYVHTEEATKNAMIMPFLQALGYNVFDPREVVPEFTADVGIKKGEKVDYAIMRDGKPTILIECKPAKSKLTVDHASQLYRYFTVTDARVAVLTNGIEYKFYSDLDHTNRMDDVPFLELDMLDLTIESVNHLKPITKELFDVDGAIEAATELKYTKAIKQTFHQNLSAPNEDFIRVFVNAIEPDRRFVQSTRDFYAPLITRALNSYIRSRVEGSLTRALQHEEESEVSIDTPVQEEEANEPSPDGIVTTEEEVEGFHIVRAIMSEIVDSSRVVMRDVKSYCGVLLDDNNRQPICRLHFNGSQNYLGLFDAEKNEERVALETLRSIYDYKDRLHATIGFYESTEPES